MGSACAKPHDGKRKRIDENGAVIDVNTGEPITTNRGRSDTQGKLLKVTSGLFFASFRIREGDFKEFYSVQSKILGSGYSGYVRLVVDRRTGRKYALKSFNKLGATKSQILMFTNEAQIYLRVDHPHIARIIELWEDRSSVSIIMEYCSGGKLFDRLCLRKTFSETSAKLSAFQMVSAIQYLHSHGIVHRDLKLDNWLYETTNENAYLKLIDFGLSKVWFPKSNQMSATCGTLVYVSPDTLLGAYTHSCDMWSFGVIMYLLLVGYPPFIGTEEDMFSRILEGAYSLNGPRWNHISPIAKDFVRRLLQKDPQKRMTAKEAYLHPWLGELVERSNKIVDPIVIESLRLFSSLARFQRVALLSIAISLSSDQIKHIIDEFFKFDVSKEGGIRLHEFQVTFQKHSTLSYHEVQHIFKTLDSSGDKQVYFNEFLAGMLTYRLPLEKETVRNVFLKFDKDRSGFISFDNVRELLGHTYSIKQLSSMFSEIDIQGNGLIDYKTFYQLMMERQTLENKSVLHAVSLNAEERDHLSHHLQSSSMMSPRSSKNDKQPHIQHITITASPCEQIEETVQQDI